MTNKVNGQRINPELNIYGHKVSQTLCVNVHPSSRVQGDFKNIVTLFY